MYVLNYNALEWDNSSYSTVEGGGPNLVIQKTPHYKPHILCINKRYRYKWS